MTEKEKLLGRVRMYDFALVEVIEYLDGHPDNAAAHGVSQRYRRVRGRIRSADRPRGGYPQRTLDVDRRSVAVGRS